MSFEVLLIFLLGADFALGTHFRGGTISWKPSGRGNEILITYRVSWRRSFNSNTQCNNYDIQNKVIKNGEGDLYYCYYYNCQAKSMTPATYFCTDYSITEDWTIGERTDFPFKSPWDRIWVGFYGRNWIDALHIGGGGDWQVWSMVNLTRRHDNGKINSSPMTTTSPIIRIQSGCFHEINILATDPDNDYVICKWADKNKEGCGGICNGLPGAVINPRICTLSYNATTLGWFGVALQIFDYHQLTDPEPLSSIPLQFLIFVYKGKEKCDKIIQFSHLTRQDQACVGVPFGTTYRERFFATSGTEDDPITHFTTSSPPGLTKASIAKVDEPKALFLEPLVNGSWYYIDVTWTPTRLQAGSNIFCFAAVTQNKIASKQRCITLYVGITPPTILTNQLKPSPGSVILSTDKTFEIVFDKRILRPLSPSQLKLWKKDYTEVFTLDASSSFNYEIGNGNKIRIQANVANLIEKETYFITLDDGFMIGTEACGPESQFVRDSSFWNFTIKDTHAPVLNFIDVKPKTNANVTFTWEYNEPATTKCSLTTPVEYIKDGKCSQTSWAGKNLADGVYILWIYGTDETGNTGLSGQYTWRVDSKPPQVTLTENYKNVSNDRTFSIRFKCDENCAAKCRLMHQNRILQNSTDCSNRRYQVERTTTLESGKTYTIEVIANDEVGNTAIPVKISWTADFIKPTISSFSNKTVKCGNSILPGDLGLPQVVDNLDPKPSLTFKDEDAAGCNILRKLTATDAAGNFAHFDQKIHIVSVQPIKVNLPFKALLPCSKNIMQVPDFTDIADYVRSGYLIHPCNKSITASFTFDPTLVTCDSLVKKNWLFTDTCGQTTSYQQSVKILPLQDPDRPKIGQTNVDLWYTLNWPEYPNSRRYRLYIWPLGSKRGKGISISFKRSYRPNSQVTWYPSNTKMFWQIEYILDNGITVNGLTVVPSPVWGFTTKPVCNLEIVSISAPQEVFTGRSVQVSWKVTNKGDGQNFKSYRWFDKVVVSKHPNRDFGDIVEERIQNRILFPGDGYTSSVILNVPKDLLGDFYVVVFVDLYQYLIDSDRENNRKVALHTIKIRLTPPPDLTMHNLLVPSTAFSGTVMEVKWSVRNSGNGPTTHSKWTDEIYFNSSSGSSYVISQKRINKQLFPDDEYRVGQNITLPKYIQGTYNVFVYTNALHEEFEYQSYDNNIGSSKIFEVYLTPPPDLRMKSIQVAESAESEERITITYNVTNQGAGKTDLKWWDDQLAILNKNSNQVEYLRSQSHLGYLERREEYGASFSLTIPSTWKSGIYLVQVSTNVNQRLFENGKFENNMISKEISIIQKLADLKVSDVQYEIHNDPYTASLKITILNATVENIGVVGILGMFWRDVYQLRCGIDFTQSLFERHLELSLQREQKYITSENRNLTRMRYSNCILEVFIDKDSNILEDNKSNNFISKPLKSKIYYDDVGINLRGIKDISSTVTNELYAGSDYTIDIAYTNRKTYTTLGELNEKLIMKISNTEYSLASFTIETLNGGARKEVSIKFRVPGDIFGSGTLILLHDVAEVLMKDPLSSITENYQKEIDVRYPPSPEFGPVQLDYKLSNNIIMINWKAKNKGNSMVSSNKWTDAIILSTSTTNPFEQGYKILLQAEMNAKLQSGQTYEKHAEVPMPSGIHGKFYLHLVVGFKGKQSSGSFSTADSLSTNSSITVKKREQPNLFVTISSLEVRVPVYGGDAVKVSFQVQNNGSTLPTRTIRYDIHLVSSFSSPLKLTSNVAHGDLKKNSGLTITKLLTIPFEIIPGKYEIKIQVDYFHNEEENKENQIATSSSFTIHELSKAEVNVITDVTNVTVVSGQPINISYSFLNHGPGNLTTRIPNYVSLVLSEDEVLDPHDIRICGQYILANLLVNQTYRSLIQCNIPFDLPAPIYFLILKASGRTIIERGVKEIFKNTIKMINLIQTLQTDLAVLDVKSSLSVVNNGLMATSWIIKNNGSKEIGRMYKCDTVYLSEDKMWDIDDTEVSKDCKLMTNQPSGSSKKTSIKSLLIPNMKQAPFHTIVKSRSGTKELNTANNIGVSTTTTLVIHNNLTLGTQKIVKMSPKGIVLRIPDVPAGETLLVTAESSKKNEFIDLFLNHANVASSTNFISYSGQQLNSKQSIVTPNVKSNDYYIFARSTSQVVPRFNVKLFAKIAVFEIASVFPSSCPPLTGEEVTFQVKGSIFPPRLSVQVTSASISKIIPSEKVHRFSSTLLYVTIDSSGYQDGDKLTIHLIDLMTNNTAKAIDAINVQSGDEGILRTSVSHPDGIRVEENFVVSISFKNAGSTDILPPIIYMEVDGRVQIKNIAENRTLLNKTLFLGTSFEKPAGILPPKHTHTMDFNVIPNVRGLGSYPIKIQRMDNQVGKSHFYVDLKDYMKPKHMSDRQWNPVWNTFMGNVGESMTSFHKRITKTASHFSLIKAPTTSINELVAYELNLADGIYLSNNLYSSVDIDVTENTFIPMQIKRYLNPKLSFRDIPGEYNGYGPFGRGWIAPLWAISLVEVREETITLSLYHEILVFQYDEGRNYFINKDIGIITDVDGNYEFEKTDQSPSIIYKFDKQRNSLLKILTNDSVSVITMNEKKTKIADNFGNEIRVEYGSNTFVQKIKHFKNKVLKTVVTYAYSEDKTLQKVAIGNDQEKAYEYDNCHFGLIKVTNQDKTSTKYMYNFIGHYIGYHDFDAKMDLIRGTTYEMTGVGHFIVREIPGDVMTEVKFDGAGRPVWFQSPGTLPTVVVNKENKREIYQDDLLITSQVNIGQISKITNAEGNTITTEFINEGASISKIIDGKGHVYSNSFNDDKNLVATTFPDGLKETFAYDINGNLKSMVSRSKKKTSFSFNEKGELLQRVSPDKSTTYSYDLQGSLTKAETKDSIVEIAYDNKRRPLTVTYDGKRSLHYSYNSKGQRMSLSDSSGEYKVTYNYDETGKMILAKQHGQKIILQNTYQDGYLKTRKTGDDTQIHYTYNNITSKLEAMQVLRNSTTVGTNFKYTRDKFGRIKITNQRNKDGSTFEWNYAYDRLSQLVSFGNSNGESNEVTYDESQNRKSLKTSKNGDSVYKVNSMNQVTSVNDDEKLTYDLNGNLIQTENLKKQIDDRYSYDSENKLTSLSSSSYQCVYTYDALGNIKDEDCNGVKTTYLVDPFGKFGADVIGEFSGLNSTYHYHALEDGLICSQQKHLNNQMLYYQYDHIGSVISITDQHGSVINTYNYDPFGNILKKVEKQLNKFLYAGQWGVQSLPHLTGVYRMRNRMYIAKYGIFASLDPLGFAGKSSNLYCYVSNNPVQNVDPKGTIPVPIAGALINVGFYLIDHAYKSFTGEADPPAEFWSGLGGTAVAGLIPIPGVGDAVGNLVKQFSLMAFTDHKFDWDDLVKDTAVGFVMGKLGEKFNSVTKGIRGMIWRKILTRFSKLSKGFRKFAEWATKTILGNIGDRIKGFIGSELYDSILNWVLSFDPNDIIGPSGYGDGHFVSRDTVLKYMIRFENFENATAPAQKVLITSELDDDLDISSFEFCSFGFGNHTFFENKCNPIVQAKLDVRETLSVYVRAFGAVDLEKKTLKFVLETLDPLTGDQPSNPLIGFLPPNPKNGTSGQGFITYSVVTKETATTYDVIDAKASIIFDQNEAIDTPPIFNTIDADAPSINMTLLNSVTNSSSLVFGVSKDDVGSGISSYNVFITSEDKKKRKYLSDISNEAFVADLKRGESYTISVDAVDHVGNLLVGGAKYSVDVPLASCSGVNNCSGNGVCTEQNVCSCDNGKYGNDCSSSTKPLEPPVIFVAPVKIKDFSSKLPVDVFVDLLGGSRNLTLAVKIQNIPQNVEITPGFRLGNAVILKGDQLKDLKIDFKNATQDFKLKIVAEAIENLTTTGISRSFEFLVTTAGSLEPDLKLSPKECYPREESHIKVDYTVGLPFDESDLVSLTMTGVPGVLSINNSQQIDNSTYFIANATTFTDFTIMGAKEYKDAINISITASAEPKYGKKVQKIMIEKCKNNNSGDDSSDSKKSNKAMVTGIVIAVLVLIIIFVAIVIRANKRSICLSIFRGSRSSC